MTDLGKTGSLEAGSARQGELSYLPLAFWLSVGGSSLTSCLLSVSDEQEDESMETTGKVEPV